MKTRIPMPDVSLLSPAKAYLRVLAEAGAAFPVRDSVDRRVAREVAQATGKIIDDPSEVGGWPTLASGAPNKDTDHDGMSDDWEEKHDLDPRNPTDGNGRAPSGNTWLEQYLDSLVQSKEQN